MASDLKEDVVGQLRDPVWRPQRLMILLLDDLEGSASSISRQPGKAGRSCDGADLALSKLHGNPNPCPSVLRPSDVPFPCPVSVRVAGSSLAVELGSERTADLRERRLELKVSSSVVLQGEVEV